MNHLSAALRSAHSCAVPLSHSFGSASPPGRKRPVRGRAPLPRLAPTVYYNLIVSCYPEQPTTPRSPPLKCDGGYASPAGLKSTRTQAESRRPNPESLARPRRRGKGPKTENRKPNYVFSIFAQKKWTGYLRRPKAEGRIPKAWPGPARGAGARRPKTENRITFLPFSPKKWSGYIPPKTESRRPNPESLARPEGQGPEDRKPKTELRFCRFRQKKWSTSEDRKPKAESRKLGPARPEGQGPEDRKPKTELRFCHFRQKNDPGTSEDRIPKAWAGGRVRGPKTENRKPNYVFAIFAKKMVRVPPKTESRRPNLIPQFWGMITSLDILQSQGGQSRCRDP